MKWTKETLVNTCILITSKPQGDQVIKFYDSFGFNNLWKLNEKTLSKGVYYGNTKHSSPHCHVLLRPNEMINIIKLPSKPRRKFPREMMVSDDCVSWHTRTVLAKCLLTLKKDEIPENGKAFEYDWVFKKID